MDVSVIIVNYNVEHFLSQCLLSVRAGVAVLEQSGYAAEVFVVDNNSVDGSCAMVWRQFPEVHLIDSKENLGFSKGNNLAIRQSKGRWVLLLNPDTIIQEDTLLKCLEYADARTRLDNARINALRTQYDFVFKTRILDFYLGRPLSL